MIIYRPDFFERDKNSGGRLATQLKNLDSLVWRSIKLAIPRTGLHEF